MQPQPVSDNPIITIEGHPFSEQDYLQMNPDVRGGVEVGSLESGEQHFRTFGIKEGRLGCYPGNLPSNEFFGSEPIDVSQLDVFRSENFPYEGPFPWLDQPNASDKIQEKLEEGLITEEEAVACRKWERDGYIIIDNAFPPGELDFIWESYEEAIAEGTVVPNPENISKEDIYPGRLLNPHFKVPALCHLLFSPNILRWVKLLMDTEPVPFQTITAHKGSEQPEHSDSIHMSTYPIGYLSAVQVAFEDIHPDSGPLVYYPGSHKLPYIFSKDVGISVEEMRKRGFQQVYLDYYEPAIQNLIKTRKLQPSYFHANKGDMLFWHANLLHGGSKRNDPRYSRKTVVCHYFVEGAISYHDLSGGLARNNTGTCLAVDGKLRRH